MFDFFRKKNQKGSDDAAAQGDAAPGPSDKTTRDVLGDRSEEHTSELQSP